jgi:hypothetical protein
MIRNIHLRYVEETYGEEDTAAAAAKPQEKFGG